MIKKREIDRWLKYFNKDLIGVYRKWEKWDCNHLLKHSEDFSDVLKTFYWRFNISNKEAPWIPGRIKKKTTPEKYHCKTAENKIRRKILGGGEKGTFKVVVDSLLT